MSASVYADYRVQPRKRSPFGSIVLMLFLLVVAVFMLVPMVYMVVNAFKPIDELLLFPPRFYVMRPTLQNFTDLVLAASATVVPFSRYIFNSTYITVMVVGVTILIGSMAGYALSNKHKFPGQGAFFAVVVSAMMFAPEVTTIPRYLIVNGLHMIDTYWALIIPPLAAPYAVFLMKQFIDGIPTELLEAAKIDGANQWTLFWKIIMPGAQSAWATLAITSFIGTWNDAFGPLVFTRREVMRTLPLAIFTIGGGVARLGALSAALLLMTAPPIIIYTLLQARVLESMTYSGIKS